MKYKWTVLTVTTVGVLMSGLDSRIIVIGLPTVAAALHADAEQAIWFTQAYVLGSTVALLFIGRVSDIFGRVKIYSLGFAIYTVGSLATSLSASPNEVILSRAIQGLGSAALFANSAAIITDAFPSKELGLALGMNSVAYRVGSMLGLTLSGLILSFLDWRYLFYINIPVGIFGTLWAQRRLKEVNLPEVRAPMDWLGFVTFTTFIASLILSLTYAAYGLADIGLSLVLGALALSSLALFVILERRTNHPLLDLGLLKIKEYTGGVVAQLLNAVAFGAFLLVISLYLQLVKGYSPLQAGIAIIPFDLAFLVVGPLSGRLSDAHGPLPFTTAGLLVVSLSMFLFSTLGEASSSTIFAIYLSIAGAGMGLFNSPNISSIMGSVPAGERGVASGLRATFFNVGFTLSFNVVVLVLTLTVPYSLVTTIIASATPGTIAASQRDLFARGLQNVYLYLALVNTIAIVPSLLRGKRMKAEVSPESESMVP